MAGETSTPEQVLLRTVPDSTAQRPPRTLAEYLDSKLDASEVCAQFLNRLRGLWYSLSGVRVYVCVRVCQYLVSPEVLKKSSSWCFDIVSGSSSTSACFTKAYSRFIRGTGSIIGLGKRSKRLSAECCLSEESERGDMKRSRFGDSDTAAGQGGMSEKHGGEMVDEAGCTYTPAPDTVHESDVKMNGSREFDPNWMDKMDWEQYRYFAPSEMLRLFGFPIEFTFPETISRKKRYELIGNSLNVHVAASVFLETWIHVEQG